MKYCVIAFLLITMSCETNCNKQMVKAEVLKVENEFMNRVADEGLAIAFKFYAADSAVIVRGNEIVKGRSGIFNFYDNPKYSNVKLVWKPDFVDVSLSADMAYTYGNYTFLYEDTSGVEQKLEGVFHTVWKKQPDGEWKFVYD